MGGEIIIQGAIQISNTKKWQKANTRYQAVNRPYIPICYILQVQYDLYPISSGLLCFTLAELFGAIKEIPKVARLTYKHTMLVVGLFSYNSVIIIIIIITTTTTTESENPVNSSTKYTSASTIEWNIVENKNEVPEKNIVSVSTELRYIFRVTHRDEPL